MKILILSIFLVGGIGSFSFASTNNCEGLDRAKAIYELNNYFESKSSMSGKFRVLTAMIFIKKYLNKSFYTLGALSEWTNLDLEHVELILEKLIESDYVKVFESRGENVFYYTGKDRDFVMKLFVNNISC